MPTKLSNTGLLRVATELSSNKPVMKTCLCDLLKTFEKTHLRVNLRGIIWSVVVGKDKSPQVETSRCVALCIF